MTLRKRCIECIHPVHNRCPAAPAQTPCTAYLPHSTYLARELALVRRAYRNTCLWTGGLLVGAALPVFVLLQLSG